METLILTKKLQANADTHIQLKYDLPNNRVILPREDYIRNPDFFIKRECPFVRECLSAAFSTYSHGSE